MRVFLGDSVKIDTVLTDSDGEPIDLTGAAVEVVVAGSDTMSGTADITDSPTSGQITYQTTADQAGLFQIRYRAVWLSTVATVMGPSLRIVDPDSAWATPADVEAVAGQPVDPDEAMAAIDQAMLLILSWLCLPVPDPLPAAFTMATAVIAAALLDAPSATDPVAETIGDYSYRLATAPDASALRSTVRSLLGTWLCGTVHSPRVWPDPATAFIYDDWEYQLDAEGLRRS